MTIKDILQMPLYSQPILQNNLNYVETPLKVGYLFVIN